MKSSLDGLPVRRFSKKPRRPRIRHIVRPRLVAGALIPLVCTAIILLRGHMGLCQISTPWCGLNSEELGSPLKQVHVCKQSVWKCLETWCDDSIPMLVIETPEIFNMEQSVLHALETAPLEWDALHFHLDENNEYYRRFTHTEFTHWFPDKHSPGGTLLSATGKRKLHMRFLQATSEVLPWQVNTSNGSSCVLAEHERILRDMIAHTRVLSLSKTSNKTRQEVKGIPRNLLVFSTTRVKSIVFLESKLELLKRNLLTLQTVVSDVHFHHFFVLDQSTKSRALRVIQQSLRNWPITFDLHVTSRRYSKFYLLNKVVHQLVQYEKVLLVDSDFALYGYAWNEFFMNSHNCVITGTVHKTIDEILECRKDEPTRQWYKIFDERWWKENFPEALAVQVPFVEQGFALFDGQFAAWFFKIILTKDRLEYFSDGWHARESDWGPDQVWCGAAREWIVKNYSATMKQLNIPCKLTVLPILHIDDRQIGLQSYEENNETLAKQKMEIERKTAKLYKRDFPHWWKYSEWYTQLIGGRTLADGTLSAYLTTNMVRVV